MKNQKKQQFIYTQNVDCANYLTSNGFTLLSDNNENYVFMNNGLLKFDKDEDKNILKNMAYTNVLCF